jgi:nicotinamide-nucleotide amidase
MNNLAEEIGILLKKHKLTMAVVESATGGLISYLITSVSGSSEYYKGSITSYSNEIKMKLVGVKKETLDKYGAVSSKVAEEMAEGGRKALGVDICISDTGIAGPTGATTNKPVGLFYLGLSNEEGTHNRKYIFEGNREENKENAALASLSWLKEYLTSFRPDDAKIQTKQVVTSFLLSNGKILILRRSDRVGTYRGRWGAVSGYVEKSPDQQALIEIKEETGLGVNDIELICKGDTVTVRDDKLKTRWIVHPYLFHVKDQEKIKLDWEHKESKWISPGEIEDYDTVPQLKETLDAAMARQYGN